MKVTYTVHDSYVGTQDGKPTGDRTATVTDRTTDERRRRQRTAIAHPTNPKEPRKPPRLLFI